MGVEVSAGVDAWFGLDGAVARGRADDVQPVKATSAMARMVADVDERVRTMYPTHERPERLSATEPGPWRRRPTGMLSGRAVAAIALAATATACAGSSAAQSRTGVVSGTVLSAPSCPVEGAGTPCPPRSVPGADVTAARGSKTIAHVTADADGRFRIQLDAGDYTITARVVGGIGSMASSRVTVPADGVATVTLTVDSGIR
jgi:hypothetical protein